CLPPNGFGFQGARVVQGGQGENQLPTPLRDVSELLGQLRLEIPRERNNHVRPVLGDQPWIVNRDPCAWRESTMFVRIAVDCVLEQVATNPAVVEQGVTLARRTVADDALAVGTTLQQKPQQIVANSLCSWTQLQVAVHMIQSGSFLDR